MDASRPSDSTMPSFQRPLPALSVKTAFVRATLEPAAQDESTIDHIASATLSNIVKDDGHRVFTIDVELEPASPGVQGGVIQVQRRFADFWNLRHELLYRVQSAHRAHKQPCAFCAAVIETLTHASALPRLHQRMFQPTDVLRSQLQDFLNLVVQLANETQTSSIARVCKGRTIVTSLVREFLSSDDRENESGLQPSGWVYTVSW